MWPVPVSWVRLQFLLLLVTRPGMAHYVKSTLVRPWFFCTLICEHILPFHLWMSYSHLEQSSHPSSSRKSLLSISKLLSLLQWSLGPGDWQTEAIIPEPCGGLHVRGTGWRPEHIHLWGMWLPGQALGHQGWPVQAELHRPHWWHQRHFGKEHSQHGPRVFGHRQAVDWLTIKL